MSESLPAWSVMAAENPFVATEVDLEGQMVPGAPGRGNDLIMTQAVTYDLVPPYSNEIYMDPIFTPSTPMAAPPFMAMPTYDDNHRGRKNNKYSQPTVRRRFRREQAQILEEAFQKNSKPDKETREAISLEIAAPIRNVQIWFQNRRAKARAMSLEQNKKHEQRVNLERSNSSGGESINFETYGLAAPEQGPNQDLTRMDAPGKIVNQVVKVEATPKQFQSPRLGRLGFASSEQVNYGPRSLVSPYVERYGDSDYAEETSLLTPMSSLQSPGMYSPYNTSPYGGQFVSPVSENFTALASRSLKRRRPNHIAEVNTGFPRRQPTFVKGEGIIQSATEMAFFRPSPLSSTLPTIPMTCSTPLSSQLHRSFSTSGLSVVQTPVHLQEQPERFPEVSGEAQLGSPLELPVQFALSDSSPLTDADGGSHQSLSAPMLYDYPAFDNTGVQLGETSVNAGWYGGYEGELNGLAMTGIDLPDAMKFSDSA